MIAADYLAAAIASMQQLADGLTAPTIRTTRQYISLR